VASSIRQLFAKIWDTAEGFRANCPRCEDTKGKLYFNEQKKVGCCFHEECAWFKDRGGVTERRLRAFLTKAGVSYAEPEVVKAAPEADVKLPDEFVPLDDLDDSLFEDISGYLESRGLTARAVQRAHLGYCEKGRFWGYIVFPVFNEDGEVVYWQGRRYKKREPKFYNPKSSLKTDLVYHIGDGKRPKVIVLVESIINAMTLDSGYPMHTVTIFALLGKAMSEEQMNTILLYEKCVKEVVIALDDDAWDEAVAIASRLDGVVPSVRIASVPRGRDINELGRAKSWDLIHHAAPFSSDRRMEILMSRKTR